MIKFVRILAFILLIGATLVFVLKLFFHVPIESKHLIIFFIVGAVSLMWANYRDQGNNK